MSYLQRTTSLFSEASSSEKGYLKKYFKTRMGVLPPKRSEQLQGLFNAIDNTNHSSQTDWPVEAAKEVFGLLIAGLEEYHKNDTTQTRSFINQVEILLEKNLNLQAEKLLAKAKKLAKKSTNYEMLYEIIEWQVAIHSLKPPTDKNMKLFDEYFNELEDVLKKQAKNFGIVL